MRPKGREAPRRSSPEAELLRSRGIWKMDLVTQYQAFARYNAWMNKNLYDLVAKLSDEDRKREVGAFFGSIHGTLSHLLLTDRTQLGRFIGPDKTVSYDADGKPIAIKSLNQELYPD